MGCAVSVSKPRAHPWALCTHSLPPSASGQGAPSCVLGLLSWQAWGKRQPSFFGWVTPQPGLRADPGRRQPHECGHSARKWVWALGGVGSRGRDTSRDGSVLPWCRTGLLFQGRLCSSRAPGGGRAFQEAGLPPQLGCGSLAFPQEEHLS